MPDDVIPEVTEQVPETPAPDLPTDEADGFASKKDDDVDENIEGLEEPIVPEKKPAKRGPKKKAAKAAEPEPEVDPELTETLDDDAEPEDDVKEDAETDDTDEADEDVIRGKELVAEQEKEEADRKAADEARKAEKVETGGYNPFHERQDAAGIEFFKGVMPEGLFPDKVTLKDGTELDFKAVLENDPEIPVMVAIIANNLIRQMIANKFLVTNADLDGMNETIDNRLFTRTVTNRTDGVPNAQKIYSDPAFKKWTGEQPKEIQALMRSSDPYDHIRVFKRYLGKAGLDDAKKNVVSLDEKRKVAKDKIDGVLKNTVRSKSAKPKGTVLSQREEEAAGFNSEDADDDYL